MVKKLKQRLALVLAVAVMTTTVPHEIFAKDYTGHWAAAAITKWEEKGILKGYEDGTFKPKNTISRAEFAQILVRVFGYTDTAKAKAYSDVAEDAWYFDAVARISDVGIMHEEGTSFRPNDAVTKEEAAYALANAYKVQGTTDKVFVDEAKISDWATMQVEAMFANGYINGTPQGHFEPQKALTRAELVTMIDHMTSNVISVAGTYTEDVAGNLVVNTRDVELKDMVIEGNLYLGEGIGDGDITLDNIEVKGQVIVEGGGINSIKSKNSKYHEKFVVSAENPVRVVIEGDAVKIEAMPGTNVTLTGNFSDVVVAPNVNMTVKDATVGTIIAAPATNPNAETVAPVITIDKSATVNKVQADAAVEVKGEGKVDNLVVNAKDVKIEQKPGNVEITKDKDITVNIAGKDESKDTVNKPSTDKPSTGGGSGSDNGSSNGGNNNSHKHDTTKKVHISGQVTYEGEGVGFAQINIFGHEDNEAVAYGKTDKDGYYTFTVPACTSYWVEGWVVDEDGYGYHKSITNQTPHSNLTVNVPLEKKHVVNFKVVDKNNVPVPGVKIVPVVNGQEDGWSRTDLFGEATRYLWNEKALYGFRFYVNEKLVHEIPESIQADEAFKKDLTVQLKNIGLDRTVSGVVYDEATNSLLIDQKVGLYEHIITGPNSGSSRRVAETVTDNNGRYTFEIPDLSKTYFVEVRNKTSEGNYYASESMDARFVDHIGLVAKQVYGVNITAVDKNNLPIPQVEVRMNFEQGGDSGTSTRYNGSTDIFGYYVQPGKHVVTAQINDEVLVQPITIEEGKYNYKLVFKFENIVNNDRMATIKVDADTVTVGDVRIPVSQVSIQSNGWGRGEILENGVATIMIPEEYQDQEVEILVHGPMGEVLYREKNVAFTGNKLEKQINLEGLTTYSLTGNVLLNDEVTTGAALSINIRAWDEMMTEVGTQYTDENGFKQDKLIKGDYLVQTQVTTDGALYMSSDRVYVDGNTTFDAELEKARTVKVKVIDEKGNALPNVLVEVNYSKRDGRHTWYVLRSNSNGEIEFVDGIGVGANIWLHVRDGNRTQYESIDNEFVMGEDHNEFTLKVRVINQ